MKRSLLPFLGDALSWLTGTATTKDVNVIKTRINKLITTQQSQQETLVHIISIFNATRYTTHVNRQHINILIDTMEKMHQDITTLYNVKHSLYSSLSYHQIKLYIWSILTSLLDSLHYMREVTIHTIDYIAAATTGILSPQYYLFKIWRWCWNTLRKHSFYHAPANLIWRHTTFLQISTYPHPNCRWTILVTDWCANTGLCTASRSIWSI